MFAASLQGCGFDSFLYPMSLEFVFSPAKVSTGYSGFLPHSRLIGTSKFPIVCVSTLQMTSTLSRESPALCIGSPGIGFRLPATLCRIRGIENNWMDVERSGFGV